MGVTEGAPQKGRLHESITPAGGNGGKKGLKCAHFCAVAVFS